MLAQIHSFQDNLEDGVVCDTLIDQAITLVWDSLLPWRDNPERPSAEGEEELNGQFCDYLESRKHPMIFFRHEQRQTGRHRSDIAVKPRKTTVISGISYTLFQPLLVIECKRLPSPTKDREKEYVTGENEKVSGGIQRFKLGLHGKEHVTAIMVGYVQEKLPKDWHPVINNWISELAKIQPDLWSVEETLSKLQCADSGQRAKSFSRHSRVNGCKSKTIGIHHFWVQMN